MAPYALTLPHVASFIVERRLLTVRHRILDGTIPCAIAVLEATINIIERRITTDIDSRVLEVGMQHMELCLLMLYCGIVEEAQKQVNMARLVLAYQTPLHMPGYLMRRRMYNMEVSSKNKDTGTLGSLPHDLQWFIGRMIC